MSATRFLHSCYHFVTRSLPEGPSKQTVPPRPSTEGSSICGDRHSVSATSLITSPDADSNPVASGRFYTPIYDEPVMIAWDCYQALRRVYHAETGQEGASRSETLVGEFASCPVPEVKRLAGTLKRWRKEILAYFATGGASNGPVEAINNLIEKTRRVAHGFRNFENYQLRILSVGSGGKRNLPTSHHT